MSERVSNIKTYLDEKFPGDVLSAELLYDFPVFTVNHHNVFEIIKALKEDPQWNFHFLTDLTGIQTEDEKQLGVIYHLHNMISNNRIRIKTFFDINKPEVKSLTTLWPGANWMERETYDFFGIRFLGHPNLKRILNVDEMDIFPLRKEFPLEDQTREDKDDRMFGR
jgi:NADH-quinone oxidoreductase subunit C